MIYLCISTIDAPAAPDLARRLVSEHLAACVNIVPGVRSVFRWQEEISENDEVSTVICAPLYSSVLGLSTEVVVGPDEGLPRTSSIRCDFLTLMFKSKLTSYVTRLQGPKLQELGQTLARALELA